MLKCPCGMVYIGQTSRTVKTRINKHKSCIRTYKEKSEEDDKGGAKYGENTVARHFTEKGHRVSELRWAVLEIVHGDNT